MCLNFMQINHYNEVFNLIIKNVEKKTLDGFIKRLMLHNNINKTKVLITNNNIKNLYHKQKGVCALSI